MWCGAWRGAGVVDAFSGDEEAVFVELSSFGRDAGDEGEEVAACLGLDFSEVVGVDEVGFHDAVGEVFSVGVDVDTVAFFEIFKVREIGVTGPGVVSGEDRMGSGAADGQV